MEATELRGACGAIDTDGGVSVASELLFALAGGSPSAGEQLGGAAVGPVVSSRVTPPR
jgi:hypothetical protein